jgi:hypothetical protein
MAVDGNTFDLPDTNENVRGFGYPGTTAGTEAQQQGLSPLRLGFTGTLRVVRRAMVQFQRSIPEEIPLF